MIPTSIEQRVFDILERSPQTEIMDALAQAFTEENKFLKEMVEGQTERSKKAKNQLCKNVYATIHLKNALA